MPTPAASSGSSLAPLACLIGVYLGAACALAGLTWSMLAKPAHVWSAEQAAEWEAANVAMHAATGHEHAAEGHSAEAASGQAHDSDELDAARERFNRINAELESARFAQNHWGTLMAGCGLALTILSGIGYLATRGQ